MVASAHLNFSAWAATWPTGTLTISAGPDPAATTVVTGIAGKADAAYTLLTSEASINPSTSPAASPSRSQQPGTSDPGAPDAADLHSSALWHEATAGKPCAAGQVATALGGRQLGGSPSIIVGAATASEDGVFC
jgi:hypothetical protein